MRIAFGGQQILVSIPVTHPWRAQIEYVLRPYASSSASQPVATLTLPLDRYEVAFQESPLSPLANDALALYDKGRTWVFANWCSVTVRDNPFNVEVRLPQPTFRRAVRRCVRGEDATLMISDILHQLALIPMMLLAQTTTVMYASAYAINDKATLLLGPSGSGKSTLAVAQALYGATFLADDMVPISGKFAYTNASTVNIRSASQDVLDRARNVHLRGTGLLSRQRLARVFRKSNNTFRIPPAQLFSLQQTGADIESVVFLSPQKVDAPILRLIDVDAATQWAMELFEGEYFELFRRFALELHVRESMGLSSTFGASIIRQKQRKAYTNLLSSAKLIALFAYPAGSDVSKWTDIFTKCVRDGLARAETA